MAEISSLYLASVAVQAGLCLAWSETPEDMFCHVVAHLYCTENCFLNIWKSHVKSYIIIHMKESDQPDLNKWDKRTIPNFSGIDICIVHTWCSET